MTKSLSHPSLSSRRRRIFPLRPPTIPKRRPYTSKARGAKAKGKIFPRATIELTSLLGPNSGLIGPTHQLFSLSPIKDNGHHHKKARAAEKGTRKDLTLRLFGVTSTNGRDIRPIGALTIPTAPVDRLLTPMDCGARLVIVLATRQVLVSPRPSDFPQREKGNNPRAVRVLMETATGKARISQQIIARTRLPKLCTTHHRPRTLKSRGGTTMNWDQLFSTMKMHHPQSPSTHLC